MAFCQQRVRKLVWEQHARDKAEKLYKEGEKMEIKVVKEEGQVIAVQ